MSKPALFLKTAFPVHLPSPCGAPVGILAYRGGGVGQGAGGAERESRAPGGGWRLAVALRHHGSSGVGWERWGRGLVCSPRDPGVLCPAQRRESRILCKRSGRRAKEWWRKAAVDRWVGR